MGLPFQGDGTGSIITDAAPKSRLIFRLKTRSWGIAHPLDIMVLTGEPLPLPRLDAWPRCSDHDPVPHVQLLRAYGCPPRRTVRSLAIHRRNGRAVIPLHGRDDIRLPDGQPRTARSESLAAIPQGATARRLYHDD